MTKIKINLTDDIILSVYQANGMDGISKLLEYGAFIGDGDLITDILNTDNEIEIEQLIIEALENKN